jgi:hypothetical protein
MKVLVEELQTQRGPFIRLRTSKAASVGAASSGGCPEEKPRLGAESGLLDGELRKGNYVSPSTPIMHPATLTLLLFQYHFSSASYVAALPDCAECAAPLSNAIKFDVSYRPWCEQTSVD